MVLAKRAAAKAARTAERLEADRYARDELIRKAHETGSSFREIAAEVGMTHQQVANVIARDPSGNRYSRPA